MWEACWAHYQTDYFHLFICLAIVALYGEEVVQQQLPADEMLLHFSSLAMHMNASFVLRKVCVKLCYYRVPFLILYARNVRCVSDIFHVIVCVCVCCRRAVYYISFAHYPQSHVRWTDCVCCVHQVCGTVAMYLLYAVWADTRMACVLATLIVPPEGRA